MPTYNIDIEARFAQAADALDKVGREAEKSGKRMEAAFAGVKKVLAGVGVALSVRAFAGFIKDAIDTADKLNDLSKSTGIAVTTLGGLGYAASLSGSNLEGVAKATGKLNIQIASAAAGNKEANQAFRVMGLSVLDASGKIKNADVVLKELANRFASYEDGPKKAALGFKVFGKSYQDILPLLDEGGAALQKNINFYEKYGKVTQDTADRADAFNDELGKAKLLASSLGQTIAGELLAPMNQLVKAFVDARDQAGLFDTVAKGFAEIFKTIAVVGLNVAYVFTTIGKEASGMAQQLSALAHFDWSKFKMLGAEMKAQAAENRIQIDALSARIMNPPAVVIPPKVKPKPRGPAPGLPDETAATEAAKLAKKQLADRLKEAEIAISAEADLLKTRNDTLQAYYDEDYLSVRAYYALRRQVQDEALQNQLQAFDAEEKALREFIAKKATPEVDRIDAQTKLKETIAKRGKVEQEVSASAIKGYFEEAKAAQHVLDTVTELVAQLDQNEGDSAEASKLRREVTNRKLRAFLTNNAPGELPRLARLEEQEGAKDQFAKRSSEIELARQRLSNQERDIESAIHSGDMSQLEGIAKIDAARKAMVPTLRAIADELERQAAITKDPATIQSVENLRSEIKALDASANAMGESLRGAFTDSLEDPLIDVVNRTKTADEALRSFFNNVAQSLLRMSARNISETLFGNLFKAGAGGSWMSMFSGGGGSGGSTVSASSRMALGGVMTEFGPMQLQRYARGGIARRPQLAMFGEGRQSEAFVPLPDGRSIPVSFDRSQVSPAMQPTLAQTQRGPKGQQGGGAPPVVLEIHPNALTHTLRDWFEGELARQAATR